MAGSKPAVSVVMPVFNAESYLIEAVQSVLTQTYKDFEFIIIDDGSTDGCHEILEAAASRDSRIVLRTQTNAGLIASLSLGCRLARGEYIARMDADDISVSTRFQKQIMFLERHKTIGIVGTWIQDIGAMGQPGPVWPLPTSPDTIPWFLMFGNCIAHPSVMVRREIIQRLQYLPGAQHVEDYDLWIRATDMTRIANIPEVLLKYRVLSHSVSSRHLSIQEEQAARIQRRLRSAVLGTDESAQTVTGDLLIRLYRAYQRKYSIQRGDDSEIAMDVLRRLYLSKELSRLWPSALWLFPKLFSAQAITKILRYGTSYITNVRYGFTTQRRIPE